MNPNDPCVDTPENRQALIDTWVEMKKFAAQVPLDRRGGAAVLVAANRRVGWILPVDFDPSHFVVAIWSPVACAVERVDLPFHDAVKHYRIGLYGPKD